MHISFSLLVDSIVNYCGFGVVIGDQGIGFGLSLDDCNVTGGSTTLHFDVFTDQGGVFDHLLGGELLDNHLSIFNGIFIAIRQIDLQKHQTSAVSMSNIQGFIECCLEFMAYLGSLFPVFWG